jgi:hypothetical protein
MLTPSQLATLKAAINANSTWAAYPLTNAYAQVIADSLNATASPAYVVWRSKVTQDEIMLNGFDWARVDNLSVGKARVWEWLFDNQEKSINPSKANVRAGIDQTWTGTAQDQAVRTAVYVHCKRNATTAEKLFATGSGTDASPSLMAFEGNLTADDVAQARELP